MSIEKRILQYIKLNPYISQQEIADNVGLSRSAVAGYITDLIKRGEIKGRAYILKEDSSIVCIGGANIDRKFQGKEKVDLYTSNPVTISESSGGVARNVAENLSKLKAKNMMMTSVGHDKEGDWLLEKMNTFNIDVSQVWRLPDERTGTYTAILDIDGEMIISTADMDIYDQITPSMIEDKWTHIGNARAVFMDTNISADSMTYMIEHCERENIDLYIDPVSIAKTRKLPDNLKGVKLIFPNKDEAELLAGMEIKNINDCEEACQQIRERGVEKVVITMGEDGCYYADDVQSSHLSPFKKKVADVTGAGDAFTAGVIFALSESYSFTHAVRLGQAAAALTLQDNRTVSPLMNEETLNKMVEEIL